MNSFAPIVMGATSGDVGPGGKTFVVLYWRPAEHIVGYHLYRSDQAGAINGATPIAAAANCAELSAIIAPGSDEWQMLANGFSSVQAKEIVNLERGLPPLSGGLSLLPYKQPKIKIVALQALANPCQVFDNGLTAEQQAMFDALAGINLKIRLARGWAYIDQAVTPGQTYMYELRGISAQGAEQVLAQGVQITAGQITLPAPPSGLTVMAGDSKVLAHWNRNDFASTYMLRRATAPAGPYLVVNDKPIFLDLHEGLDGSPLPPNQTGYVDFQRWDKQGNPEPHEVNGIPVEGPTNGVTYYYQVASCDILGRIGAWSAHRATQPVDRTPPMAPDQFAVNPCTIPAGLALSWRKVNRDAQNHVMDDTWQRYDIYRADAPELLDDLAGLATHSVGQVTANPSDLADMTVSWVDTDPVLFPAYGEKDFWYRLRCVDAAGNVSAPSAAIAGRVPDTTPPGPTVMKGAAGYAKHITVYWGPNSEPDLAGYQVYRSLCDRGQVYLPPQERDKPRTCDFLLVGQVSLAEAQARTEEQGAIYFDDTTVPPGSPVCYAYWVRAYDFAQNLYPGDNGCPAKAEEYVCQRLYEEDPPPAPVIAALRARNNGVLVEWIASPIQDLKAFHIYRSDKEAEPPQFIGCVLRDGTVWPGPWTGMTPHCDEIPAEADPHAVRGQFLDGKAEPNKEYWYRVSAVDWLGNESEGGNLSQLPAISTFTYTRDLPPAPAILPPLPPAPAGCGLVVSWSTPPGPPVDGFLVFRSTLANGVYRQVSPLVAGTTFTDESALRGKGYWYRVQAVSGPGRLSEPSAPVYHTY